MAHDPGKTGQSRGKDKAPRRDPEEYLSVQVRGLMRNQQEAIEAYEAQMETSIKKMEASNKEMAAHVQVMFGPKLFAAVRCGDDRTVQRLLDVGLDVNACDPQTGMSVLHYAASVGAAEVIDLLLKRDGLNCLVKDHRGRLPSTYAYLAGEEALGEMLIERQVAQAEAQGVDYETLLSGEQAKS